MNTRTSTAPLASRRADRAPLLWLTGLSKLALALALALSGCAQNGLRIDRPANGATTLGPVAAAPATTAQAKGQSRASALIEAPRTAAAGTSTEAPSSTADATQFQKSYDDEAAGKLEAALSALDGVGAAGTAGYVAQLRRGWLLYRMGKHADAVKAYAKASALDPASVEARVGALVPLGELRRWIDIEAMAKEIVRKDPANYTANLRLAFALYSQAKFAEAEAAYRTVLVGAPSDVDARAGLGWSQLKLGKNRDAQVTFSELLGYAPKNALALEGMKALGLKG
jgi:tetratricopeptide (TPR) repeat protein